jgi:hypothetical protein
MLGLAATGRCLMVDRDHAELPAAALSYHPANIALPALAGGRLLGATRYRLDLRRSVRCACKREAS